MSDFDGAIAQLKVSLEIARNNEPIYREEGNTDQAETCRVNGDSYEAAIAALGG